jgi:hypothetical protein
MHMLVLLRLLPPPPLLPLPLLQVFKATWRGTVVAVKIMVLPSHMTGKEKREKMAVMVSGANNNTGCSNSNTGCMQCINSNAGHTQPSRHCCSSASRARAAWHSTGCLQYHQQYQQQHRMHSPNWHWCSYASRAQGHRQAGTALCQQTAYTRQFFREVPHYPEAGFPEQLTCVGDLLAQGCAQGLQAAAARHLLGVLHSHAWFACVHVGARGCGLC